MTAPLSASKIALKSVSPEDAESSAVLRVEAVKSLPILLAVFFSVPAFASSMVLDKCAKRGDSLSLRFVSASNEQRRVTITNKGYSLGGTVKGDGPLSRIKEVELEPSFLIRFAESQVEFGPLTAHCKATISEFAKTHGLAIRA
jgi:hypothetical protein